jgi:hypothetical protein
MTTETPMCRLIIGCPKTQQPLPTGIRMNEAAFKDRTKWLGYHATSCPHCHGVHRWSKDNAVLEPDPPMRQP